MANRRAAARRKIALSLEEVQVKKAWARSWLDEAFAVLCFALAVFLLASFISYKIPAGLDGGIEQPMSRRNLVGPVGHLTGTLLSGSLGYCALVPVLCLIWFSIFLWRYDSSEDSGRVWLNPRAAFGFIGVIASSCLLAFVFFGRGGGGSLGDMLAAPLVHLFDPAGATLIGAALLLLSLAFTTRTSVLDVLGQVGGGRAARPDDAGKCSDTSPERANRGLLPSEAIALGLRALRSRRVQGGAGDGAGSQAETEEEYHP